MTMFIDLHIHSRYSRACSPRITLESLERHARMKGIDILATGDITHPLWSKEIKNLEERDGLFFSKTGFPFMLSGEVSNIYSQNGKTRRIHNLILVKTFDILDAMNSELSRYGKLGSDGRPILKLSCAGMMDALERIDKSIEVIPAHIWTPWFSLFGSMSGFDSIEECFGSHEILALETGLSADPAMCSTVSALSDRTIVSFSDAHSEMKIGREATEIECDKSFGSLVNGLRDNRIKRTVEFFPEEGKYHFDGHRNCGVSVDPRKVKNDLCRQCGRKMTLGVLRRVLELGDGEELKTNFVKTIPLQEIIASAMGKGPATKGVMKIYFNAVEAFGSELNVLLNAPEEKLHEKLDKKIADYILAVRRGKVSITPGYDGVYGKIGHG